jgi:hypothetical protein
MEQLVMCFDEPERWLPVVGWEGRYEVSDQGNVRSLWAPNGPRRVPRLLKPRVHAPAPNGRMLVFLCDGKRRKPQPRLVHHLVLEAFVGPRPDGQETRHGPGGALDNRLVNLRWGTHVDNIRVDKERDGTVLFGERHPSAKLTEADVREIRRRRAEGEMMKVLAAEFGVDQANISAIVNRRSWKRLE